MSNELIGIIGIIFFLVLIAFKMPIAYAMFIVGFVGCTALVSISPALSLVSMDIFATFTSPSLSVIVMFVWMGFIAYYAGVGTNLYNFADKLMGH